MGRALALAARAEAQGEVLVGAIVVRGGQVIGEGWSQPITLRDTTAHAEVLALRPAARYLDDYRLAGATLYVTLEPCPMGATALVHARSRDSYSGRGTAPGRGGERLQPRDGVGAQSPSGHFSAACSPTSAGRLLRGFFERRRANRASQDI